jgi:LacI family transcriptional regulator
MFQTYTIKDIAKALNLSTSTVSRALNGSHEIGSETKKLVLEYAEKINYRPNPIALSLKEQKSHSIGVVVCEVANNYFSQAINGIESIAYNSGYHVIITQTHESAERELSNVQHLLSRQVDGLLVSLSAQTVDTSIYEELHSKGFPIVFFDRVAQRIPTHRIVVDNFDAAYKATESLITSGFKRIAHLTSTSNLMISQERFSGFKAALEKHGIDFPEAYFKQCNHGGVLTDEIEHAVEGWMRLPAPPDAILSTNDRLTTGCVPILKSLGYKIPDDVALIGFTNSAELFDPPLTVVRQPAFQMGQMATELLVKTIESKQPVETYTTEVLETELICRESSIRP